MVMIKVQKFSHLDPAYQRYAGLSDEERIAWIKADRWIGFAQTGAALDRLDALLAYPPRDRMPCLLIYGDTGMGKTKIVRKFERDHPAIFCQATGVTHHPVVVAQVPSEPIERDLYRELLASMGAPALSGGTLAREKDVCRSLLRTVGVRMIILDEVNGMLAGTYRQQRIFLNAIRFLANDLRVPLVCAGTDLARQALLTDAQLAERFEAFHLKPWKNDTAFAGLLKSLGHILPLRKPSDLISAKVRSRIYALTSGVTARIFRLIETAAEESVLSGKELIDIESFGDNLVLPLVSMTQASRRRAGRAMSQRASQ
ncbi:MAG: transposase [Robiginitomaculum sp.]|nr:MAG: transposase [Robiginitomaculum sp.]